MDGENGLRRGLAVNQAVMTVDHMVPRIDRTEVIRRLKEKGIATPPLILTLDDLERSGEKITIGLAWAAGLFVGARFEKAGATLSPAATANSGRLLACLL